MKSVEFGDTSNLRNISPLKEFDFDGTIITIRLYFNSVDNSIYMNIYDENDNVLSNGVKLVPNLDFIEKIAYKLKKPFMLWINGTSDDNIYNDVTVENFGKEMQMWYAENV